MSEIYKPKINRINYVRKPEIEKKYQDHLLKLKNENISIDDYIMETVLKDNFFVITKNPFPYDIDYIEHYLVWVNTSIRYSYESVYNYIKNYFYNKEFYYFENDEKNKSILRVKHFHIFVFNKTKEVNLMLD